MITGSIEYYEILIGIGTILGIAAITITAMWANLIAKMEAVIHPQHRDRDALLNRVL